MEALAFLTEPFLGQPGWAWLLFGTIVVALLVFDLGVLHRKEREIPVGESLLLSAGYIAVALLFGIGAKIFWNHFYGKLDPSISLGVTIGLLAAGILYSLWKTRGGGGHGGEAGDAGELPAGPAPHGRAA